MAREAALALDDEQHKAVYRHIAAGNGRQAMASYKEFTGVGLRDSVVAIHALNQYPQPSPSELRLDEELDGGGSFDEEYLEDSIDAVREDTDSSPFEEERLTDEGPLAEADPNTGEIIGQNEQNVPNIPGADSSQREGDDVDARARELMRESGFDPEAELTIPDEWAAPEADDELKQASTWRCRGVRRRSPCPTRILSRGCMISSMRCCAMITWMRRLPARLELSADRGGGPPLPRGVQGPVVAEPFFSYGGAGGIRTHGAGLLLNGFQDRLLRPLGHRTLA